MLINLIYLLILLMYKKKIVKSTIKPLTANAKYLIIVESPSKCSKIENYLGEDYCCIASKGHIRTLNGLKSINIKSSFEPEFSIIEEKKSHIQFMHNIISKFSKSNIILASDDDREGEAIAWHICKVFDLSIETTKRIIFHEITKPAIVNAINNPTTININLVLAQHSRQVLDVIVGYKISPFLWKYLYNNKSNSLSAGRCQTPALRLVYDNEMEKNSELEKKYKTNGFFTSQNILFNLKKEFEKSEEVIEFLEKTKMFEHKLKVGSQKKEKISPPKPFNTSRLLQIASNVLHYSPKETMNLCQSLYQNGYITYMRTDSNKYSSNFLKEVETKILNDYNGDYIGNLSLLENKDINNPHEAIRVTNINVNTITNENKHLCSMYKLIWRNSIESCMSESTHNSIDITITAPFNNRYEYELKIPIFLGWKKLFNNNENNNDLSSQLLYFQTLEKSGKPIEYKNIGSSIVIKHKHSHYTEASLINKLEDLGIGRPSTFATIIETIQERGYVKKMDLEGDKVKCTEYKLINNNIQTIETEKIFGNEKNKLVIQPIGILTIEFLIKNFQKLFEYEYTKLMEIKLDEISFGYESDWRTICKTCYNEIKDLSKELKKIEKQSYILDENNDFIFEKYGAVIRHKLEDGTFDYKQVKKDIKIDLEKLKNKEYSVDDLIEIKNNHLGKYENNDIFIKNGRFGPYVEWGEKKLSIKNIDIPLDKITLEDIEKFIKSDKTNVNKNIIRVINNDFSIRKGKFGAYMYYKRNDMMKPEFYNIKKFPEGFLTCDPETIIDWVKTKYNIC